MIFSRETFLQVKFSIGNLPYQTCPVIDKHTNCVFLVRGGNHKMFTALLYANKHNYKDHMLHYWDASDNFIMSCQGYYFSGAYAICEWIMSKSFYERHCDHIDKKIIGERKVHLI